MSRVLKFRAFNRDNNDTQMYHNVFPQGEELAVAFNNDGIYDTCNLADFHVMEYTGLKDIDGEEIFEWDILKMKPNINVEPQHYIVFRHYGGEYRLDAPAHGCPLWLRRNDVKVVGNVFENPELMDKDFVERRMREVGL